MSEAREKVEQATNTISEQTGFPMPLLIGLGVAVAGLVVGLVAPAGGLAVMAIGFLGAIVFNFMTTQGSDPFR